jgi:hypothetical protein
MYRKPHHRFLQKFPLVGVLQVAMCVSSQVVKGLLEKEVSQKGFAMSSNSQTPLKNKSFRPNGSYKST